MQTNPYASGSNVVPILDDSEARSASDFVWAETQVNWERVAEHRQQALDDLTGAYHALEGELSDALMWRDILWPIGFFAGVLCGIGFQWFV